MLKMNEHTENKENRQDIILIVLNSECGMDQNSTWRIVQKKSDWNRGSDTNWLWFFLTFRLNDNRAKWGQISLDSTTPTGKDRQQNMNKTDSLKPTRWQTTAEQYKHDSMCLIFTSHHTTTKITHNPRPSHTTLIAGDNLHFSNVGFMILMCSFVCLSVDIVRFIRVRHRSLKKCTNQLVTLEQTITEFICSNGKVRSLPWKVGS